MIISLQWLKKYVETSLTVDELVSRIGERLVEVEGVEYIGDAYADVVVAEVKTCQPLEGSDHLSVVTIDDAGAVADVERNEYGYVQVVCGAPNVREGIKVAWLPPRAVVPSTRHDAEPFVLSAKPLRGVVSNGMLASAKELDLFDEHEGILELDADAVVGESFAKAYELDDYLIEIENKSLTHRPDTFGVIGFAREVAGILGVPFVTPSWLADIDATLPEGGASLSVAILGESISERFQAIVLEGMNESSRSPLWMQLYLARSGVRPISAAVDISNYLMLLTGQPTHMYDYDKLLALAGDVAEIRVRLANEDETLTLLDGKTITLDPSDIVISAGAQPVGLAGVMGGQSTVVDGSTTRVLLEVATFDLYHIRSTYMRHGIFSEAVTRFTKGIPAPLGRPVLLEAVRMLQDMTDAKPVGGIIDVYPGRQEPIVVEVAQDHCNQVLGTYYSAEDIVSLLENVGFSVATNHGIFTVTVPYWREDIHIPEDVIEEVGRLAGYDSITATLPLREVRAVRPSAFDIQKTRVRSAMIRLGAHEVLTYSFIHGDTLKKWGQNPQDSYRITNSISPDLQYYRQSLLPSLLGLVHLNVKAKQHPFTIFEINKVHTKKDGLTQENVPAESYRMAAVVAASGDNGSTYYRAKAQLEAIARQLGVILEFRSLASSEVPADISAGFEPQRSAGVYTNDGQLVGVVGEFTYRTRQQFKLDESVAGFEIYLQTFTAYAKEVLPYRALSRYPSVERDVCFQVPFDTRYADLQQVIDTRVSSVPISVSYQPLDIYAPDTKDYKNITFRFTWVSYEETLTGDKVSEYMNNMTELVANAVQGKVV